MPLFKMGHQPKTHMASTFNIEKDDRVRYEQSVTDPTIPLEEIALRAAITSWAHKQKPVTEAWMYVWNAAVPE